MKALIRKLLHERLRKISPEKEIFSAYHGRYQFNVDLAYDLINKNKIKFTIKEFSPIFLNQFAHKDFSDINQAKLDKLKQNLNTDQPIGILIKFQNPNTKQSEWLLIDGNHRARAAAENEIPAKLYVISDPKDVDMFMKFNKKIDHQLFVDY